MLLTGIYDGKEVLLEYNGEDKPCYLIFRYLPPIDIVIDRGEFANPKSLSAQLRSDLSYKDCCDLLFWYGIPKTSGLWALNHDGYPSDHFIKLHFPEQAGK